MSLSVIRGGARSCPRGGGARRDRPVRATAGPDAAGRTARGHLLLDGRPLRGGASASAPPSSSGSMRLALVASRAPLRLWSPSRAWRRGACGRPWAVGAPSGRASSRCVSRRIEGRRPRDSAAAAAAALADGSRDRDADGSRSASTPGTRRRPSRRCRAWRRRAARRPSRAPTRALDGPRAARRRAPSTVDPPHRWSDRRASASASSSASAVGVACAPRGAPAGVGGRTERWRRRHRTGSRSSPRCSGRRARVGFGRRPSASRHGVRRVPEPRPPGSSSPTDDEAAPCCAVRVPPAATRSRPGGGGASVGRRRCAPCPVPPTSRCWMRFGGAGRVGAGVVSAGAVARSALAPPFGHRVVVVHAGVTPFARARGARPVASGGAGRWGGIRRGACGSSCSARAAAIRRAPGVARHRAPGTSCPAPRPRSRRSVRGPAGGVAPPRLRFLARAARAAPGGQICGEHSSGVLGPRAAPAGIARHGPAPNRRRRRMSLSCDDAPGFPRGGIRSDEGARCRVRRPGCAPGDAELGAQASRHERAATLPTSTARQRVRSWSSTTTTGSASPSRRCSTRRRARGGRPGGHRAPKRSSSCARLKPDVVLMDVRMPLMDGIEATRRLKALPPVPRDRRPHRARGSARGPRHARRRRLGLRAQGLRRRRDPPRDPRRRRRAAACSPPR